MKFKYFLDNSAGWAGVIFESGSFSAMYRVSHCLGDDIGDLLKGLVVLLKEEEPETEFDRELKELGCEIPEKDNDYKWLIDEEGSTIEMIFSLCNDSDKINLKIIEIIANYIEEKRDWEEEKICVFNEEIDLNELVDNILESCSEILTKYGIIGYYNNFWHEFPILNYLLLKNYRRKKLIFDTFEEKCPHGIIEEMRRTNLKGEIEYLLNE